MKRCSRILLLFLCIVLCFALSSCYTDPDPWTETVQSQQPTATPMQEATPSPTPIPSEPPTVPDYNG